MTKIAYAAADNAEGNLLSDISASTLTIPLESGDGALFPQPYTGAASSTGDSQTLNDTGDLADLNVGDFIYNETDGSWAVVLVAGTNSVSTTRLRGGSDNTWTSGDTWRVNQFVITIEKRDVTTGEVTNREEALIINRTTDNLSVKTGCRGYDGTTAQAFVAGDYVTLQVTAVMQRDLLEIIGDLADYADENKTAFDAFVADLADTANGVGASLVGIEDAGAYFAATDVEAALQELAASSGAEPTVDILIVGAGGGGGGAQANSGGSGGGGGGGVKHLEKVPLAAGAYTVTVGTTAGTGGTSSGTQGTNGEDSAFAQWVAHGGGGGGGTAASNQARIGGSGGGEAWANGGVGAIGTDGFRGGKKHASNQGGAGGGGATAKGTDVTTTAGSAGGAGYTSSISGSSVVYGSGGGGGSWNSGGAGAGGTGAGNGGNNSAGANATGYGGGGGGAGGTSGAAYAGGNGYQGVVIVRYLTADWGTCTGGTITTSGSYTIHTFTSSGTFTLVSL